MEQNALTERLAAVAVMLLALAALAVLWVLLLPLPHIASLTAPLTSSAIQDGAICVAWLLAVYLLLVPAGPCGARRDPRAGMATRDDPVRRHSQAGAATATHTTRERFQPRYALTPTPRPISDGDPARAGRVDLVQANAPATVATIDRAPSVSPTDAPQGISISLLGPLRIQGVKLKRAPSRELVATRRCIRAARAARS